MRVFSKLAIEMIAYLTCFMIQLTGENTLNKGNIMIMRKFYQNKLWRSKLAAQREKDGAIVHFTPLNDAEYSEELGLKLIEEAEEVLEATTPDKMMSEVADILETIDCLLALHNVDYADVLALKAEKKAQRGSYSDRKVVEYVEYPDGSKEALKCLENADKYPELFAEDFQDEFEDENEEDSSSKDDKCCSKKC